MSTKTKTNYPAVLAAVIAGDTASWALADALAAEVAPGVDAFTKADWDALAADLAANGAPAGLTWQSARQSRAAGLHYVDPAHRVPGVSFTAHRLAVSVGTPAESAKFLTDLVAANNGNAAKVTVKAVQTAIAATSTNPRAGTSTKATATANAGTGNGNGNVPAAEMVPPIILATRQVKAITRSVLADAPESDVLAFARELEAAAKRVAAEVKRRGAPTTKSTTKSTAPAKAPAKAKAKRPANVGMRN